MTSDDSSVISEVNVISTIRVVDHLATIGMHVDRDPYNKVVVTARTDRNDYEDQFMTLINNLGAAVENAVSARVALQAEREQETG